MRHDVYDRDPSLRVKPANEISLLIFDGLEGRPNGRILCYDPKSRKTSVVLRNLIFPNGICVAHDGKSIFFVETYRCTVSRYWLEGEKKGRLERVIDNLPGHPDNINRASDGNYWLALAGVRSPVWDLAMVMPGFRARMVKRIPRDEWLSPDVNQGCAIKMSPSGEILDCMWDAEALHNPTITSMREDRGWLYLGGLTSNRITRIKLPNADPNWTSPEAYWPRQGSAR